jgi:hypothetical protein
VGALVKHGVAPDPAHFDLYAKIARAGIAKRLFGPVRDMLYRLTAALAATKGAPAPPEILQRMLALSHMAFVREQAAQNGMDDIAAKNAIALLRCALLLGCLMAVLCVWCLALLHQLSGALIADGATADTPARSRLTWRSSRQAMQPSAPSA